MMLKSFKKGELDVNAFSRPVSMKDEKKDKKKEKFKKEQKGGKKKGKKGKKGNKGKGEKKGDNIENLLKFILSFELEGNVQEINKYISIFKTLNSKFAIQYREKVNERIRGWINEDIYNEFMLIYYNLKDKKKENIYKGDMDEIERDLIAKNKLDEFKEVMKEGFKKLEEDENFLKLMKDLEERVYNVYDFNVSDYRSLQSNKKFKINLKIPEDLSSDELYESMFIFLVYLNDAYNEYYNVKNFNLKQAPSIMSSAINRNMIMKLVLRGIEVYLFHLRKSFLSLVDFIRKELISEKGKLLSENEKKKKEIEELKKIKNELNRKINEVNSNDKRKRLVGIREKIEEKIKKIEK